MLSKIEETKKTKNLSLELLRFFLCFWIVICHSCDINNRKLNKIKNSKYHVPSFIIISFYFFYGSLYRRNINKIKLRFERLLIPYIIWPILIIIVNNSLLLFNLEGIFDRKILLYDLLLQLIFGRQINLIFWFQFNLLFITLIFTIFSFIFKKKFLYMLYLLFIISYISQYSKLNFKFFTKYNDLNYRNLGSIAEIIPFAVTGITCGYLNVINKFKNIKLKIFFISIIILYFLLEYDLFINIIGFRYPGFQLNLGGMILFFGFSIIPIKNIKNQLIIKLIKCITKYTGGIYYLHIISIEYLKKKFY